ELTSYLGRRAAEWLQTRAGDRPFFLWVSFVQPHTPYLDAPEWADVYRDADIGVRPTVAPRTRRPSWARYLDLLADHGTFGDRGDEFRREVARHYYGSVSLVDAQVGELVAAAGSDTWVIYTADHGDMLGEHDLWGKVVFYRPSVCVPAIIRPPGGGTARTVTAPVEAIELSSTLLSLAGDPAAPSLLDGAGGHPVISEVGPPGPNYFVAVRDGRWRATFNPQDGEWCELF